MLSGIRGGATFHPSSTGFATPAPPPGYKGKITLDK